jgi:hypothetical protein
LIEKNFDQKFLIGFRDYPTDAVFGSGSTRCAVHVSQHLVENAPFRPTEDFTKGMVRRTRDYLYF